MPNFDTAGLNLTIEGYGEFQQEITNISKSLGNVDKSLSEVAKTSQTTATQQEQVTKSTKKLADGYGGLTQKAITFNQVSSAVNQVMDVATKVYDATAKKAMDYGVQVRGLAMYTGQSTEETSKLIQVSDDLKVEFGTLEMAAKFMFKNGLEPSVESLARLSDQYLAISDPLARAEFLTKNFGRAGMDMAEAMNRGGTAIRAMGEDIAPALILTKDQAQAAEDARAAQDNFNDAILAVSVSIGNSFLPAITAAIPSLIWFFNLLGEGIKVGGDLSNQLSQLANAGNIANAAFMANSTTFEDYDYQVKMWNANAPVFIKKIDEATESTWQNAKAAQGAAAGTDTWTGALRDNWLQMQGDTWAGSALEKEWKRMKEEAKGATKEVIPLTDAEKKAAEAAEEAEEKTRIFALSNQFLGESAMETAIRLANENKKIKETVDALAEAEEATLGLSLAMSGALGNEIQNFVDKTTQLDDELKKVADKITELQSKKFLNKAQKSELEELKAKYKELEGQYAENAAAHDEATKRILYDMVLQRLSLGGLSKDEMAVLAKLQHDWGLIDDATYEAYKEIDKYADRLEDGTINAEGLADELSKLPRDLNINVDITGTMPDWLKRYLNPGAPTPGGGTGTGGGGSGWTDPKTGIWYPKKPAGMAGGGLVYQGMDYPVGERGTEWFRPQSNGIIIPNNVVRNYSNSIANKNTVNKNYNLSVITNQSQSAVTSSFGIMRLIG